MNSLELSSCVRFIVLFQNNFTYDDDGDSDGDGDNDFCVQCARLFVRLLKEMVLA